MTRGKPWTFRLECTKGRNAFWLCTGRGRSELVEVHFGGIGNKPSVILKDWTYVEAKTPEKLAKGYVYVPTDFVRVRQASIDAVKAGLPSGPVKPKPTPAVQSKPRVPVPTRWRCDSGGVTMTLQPSMQRRTAPHHIPHRGRIVIEFDLFPAPWQGAAYGLFKDELTDYCTKRMGRPIQAWWGGDDSEIFHVRCDDPTLFKSLVIWFQQQIGVAATPLVPAPKMGGPFGKVVLVMPKGKGKWHALDATGDKLLDLTTKGARDLVANYPHIKVRGL